MSKKLNNYFNQQVTNIPIVARKWAFWHCQFTTSTCIVQTKQLLNMHRGKGLPTNLIKPLSEGPHKYRY